MQFVIFGDGNMIRSSLANAEAKVNARLAMGSIVIVDPSLFSPLLTKIEYPLVVVSCEKVIFTKLYKYLTIYRGLVFYTDSKQPITLPDNIELIEAERIWTPT